MFLTKNCVYHTINWLSGCQLGVASVQEVQAKAGLGGVWLLEHFPAKIQLKRKKNDAEKCHQKTVENLPSELRRRRRNFPRRDIKFTNSLPPDVQMYSNKVWCVGLGQGCVLKVVWKGFGRSIKMKENFADLIFQIFWSKTAEICVELC